MITEKGLILLNDIINIVANEDDSKIFREKFLLKLNQLIDFDLGIFDVCKNSLNRTLLYDPIVFSKFDQDIENDFIYEYDTKFAAMSYSRWLHTEERSIIARDTDLLSDRFRKTSKYYTEYLQKYGFEYVINCEYAFNNINLACLSLYRSDDFGDFTNSEVSYLELLIPCVVERIKNSKDYTLSDSKADLLDKFNLTEREKNVVSMIFEGSSNKEIADYYYLSEHTVKKHLSNIYNKMGINSRMKLINFLNVEHYKLSE